MSLKPLRTDLSCPRSPRKSMSASMSMAMPAIGTSKSAALAAMPEVRHPASAATRLSAAVGPASTPPRPAGASMATKNRRVGGAAGLPRTSWAPISMRALTPRFQVERSLTVRFPSAGFSRIFRSISFMPSTSTSFSPSAMVSSLGLRAVQLELERRVQAVAGVGGGHRQGQLDQLAGRELRGHRRVERVVHLAGDGQLLGVANDQPFHLAVGGAPPRGGGSGGPRRGAAHP